MPVLPRAYPPMSRLWQHYTCRAVVHRPASVAWSAQAVRPAAASARAPVFQGLCAPALPGDVGSPSHALRRRAATITVASKLIGIRISRKVEAMRPSPNPNTRLKVSTRLPRAFGLPSCAFGCVGARPLPGLGFGTRGRPNHSFKRTGLRPAAYLKR